jgi:hypothetical protein
MVDDAKVSGFGILDVLPITFIVDANRVVRARGSGPSAVSRASRTQLKQSREEIA